MHTCKQCGVTISAKLKFCSLRCSNTYRESCKPVQFKFCITCNKSFKAQGATKAKKFCSRSCAASYNNSKTPKRKKTEKQKTSKKVPDADMVALWRSGEVDGGTKYGYARAFVRRYIFDLYKHKCSVCDYQGFNEHTGSSILQIDHIDGDSSNNTESNLRLLCPNCHAKTPTFCALNTGNGRAWKAKYNATKLKET